MKKRTKINLSFLLAFTISLMSIFIFDVKVHAVNTVNVAAYGAVADDGADDGYAIRSAIDAAIAMGPGTEVVFGPGRYHVSPAPQEWEFNTDGNMEGWQAGNGSGSVSDGKLLWTIAGSNSSLVSSGHLTINASKFKYLKIKLKNSTSVTSAKLYWTTQNNSSFSDPNSKTITNLNANDDAFTEYVFDMSTVSSWYANMIKQLKLQVIGASSGSIQIDYIFLTSVNAATTTIPAASDLTGRHVFMYKNLNGISFKGQSTTELDVTDPFCGVFKIDNSANVTFDTFSIDFTTPPFVQGTVIAYNKGARTFDYQVMDGYTGVMDNWKAQKLPEWWGTIRDQNNPYLMKPSSPDYIPIVISWSRINSNTYRMNVPDYVAAYFGVAGRFELNDKYVLIVRSTSFSGFDIPNCNGVTVKNITVYKNSGPTVAGQNVKGNITVDGLKIKRRSSDQYITTPADGIHLQESEKGPQITNCYFEGLCDDAVALYQIPSYILEVTNATKVRARSATYNLPAVGESIQFYDNRTGTLKGTATIASIEPISGLSSSYEAYISFAGPAEGLTANADINKADWFYNVTRNFRNYKISGTTFKESRRYGILARPATGVVDSCTFIDMGGAGVAVQNSEGSFNSGPVPGNITIQNNTFIHCNYLEAASYSSPQTGSIQIYGYRAGGQLADAPLIDDVTLNNNTIKDSIRNAIFIGAAKNIDVQGAVISNNSGDAAVDGDIAGIRIENASNIALSGLSITDPRVELNAGVQVGQSCSSITFGSYIYSLAEGVPNIRNLGDIEIVFLGVQKEGIDQQTLSPGTFTGNIRFYSFSQLSAPMTLAIAKYRKDTNQLAEIKLSKPVGMINSGLNSISTDSISLGNDYTQYKLQLMLLDSITNLKPLIGKVTVE